MLAKFIFSWAKELVSSNWLQYFLNPNSLTLNQCFLDVIFMLFERTTVMKKEIFGLLQLLELTKSLILIEMLYSTKIDVQCGEVFSIRRRLNSYRLLSWVSIYVCFSIYTHNTFKSTQKIFFCAAADPTPSKRHKPDCGEKRIVKQKGKKIKMFQCSAHTNSSHNLYTYSVYISPWTFCALFVRNGSEVK